MNMNTISAFPIEIFIGLHLIKSNYSYLFDAAIISVIFFLDKQLFLLLNFHLHFVCNLSYM